MSQVSQVSQASQVSQVIQASQVRQVRQVIKDKLGLCALSNGVVGILTIILCVSFVSNNPSFLFI